MPPEALWDLASIAAHFKCDMGAARLIVTHPDFPRPVRPMGRGSRRWFANEVCSYIRPPDEDSEDHVLYRFLNASGDLLYVGISMSALTRFRTHRLRSHWFRQVATVHVSHFATRREALDAESEAIRSEHPRYNGC